jgi:uncharacterized lipoprotein NlpE involved in copper resistance
LPGRWVEHETVLRDCLIHVDFAYTSSTPGAVMPKQPISEPPRGHFSPARLGVLAAGSALAIGLTACTIPFGGGSRPQPTLTAAAMPPAAVSDNRQQQAVDDRGPALPNPQTFRGVIPCADCSGQRITLTLFPDWSYRMRRVYLGTRDGKDATYVTAGTWKREQDDRIVLSSSHDENQFEMTSPTTLRLLDQQGDPIRSMLNFDLTQQFEVDLIKE